MLVALGLVRAGLPDSAKRVALRAHARAVAVNPPHMLDETEAYLWSWLGEKDKAFDLLNEYLRAHPEQISTISDDDSWMLEDLWSDPRWQDLKKTSHSDSAQSGRSIRKH